MVNKLAREVAGALPIAALIVLAILFGLHIQVNL